MHSAVDLRRMCVHEASHAIMSTRLGLPAQAQVWFNGDQEWLHGVCEVAGLSSASPEVRALIGGAGIVGELLDAGVTSTAAVAYAVARNIRTNRVSDVDRELMGENFDAHVSELIEILTTDWPNLIAEAERLRAQCIDHLLKPKI